MYFWLATNLSRTDVKMKDAAKKIGKQFACGSSVSKAPSGAEEVVIQGDVLMDLPGFLETTFNVRGQLLDRVCCHSLRFADPARWKLDSLVQASLPPC